MAIDDLDIREGDTVAVPLLVKYVDPETGRISLGDEYTTHMSVRRDASLSIVRHAVAPGDLVRVQDNFSIWTFLGEAGDWAVLSAALTRPVVVRRDSIRRAVGGAKSPIDNLVPVLSADGDAVGLEPAVPQAAE